MSQLLKPYYDRLNSSRLLGLDHVLNELASFNDRVKNDTNYPPYNIIQTGENTQTLELAVAGFKRSNLTITLENRILKIEGDINYSYSTKDNTESKNNELKPESIYPRYLNKGLSKRHFQSEFRLSEHMSVNSVILEDGVLKIDLENIIPESLKPKQFEIK